MFTLIISLFFVFALAASVFVIVSTMRDYAPVLLEAWKRYGDNVAQLDDRRITTYFNDPVLLKITPPPQPRIARRMVTNRKLPTKHICGTISKTEAFRVA